MKSRSIFGIRFFAKEEIQLGNLIPNVKQPDLNNLRSPLPIRDITVKEVEDLVRSSHANSSIGLGAFLTTLVQTTFSRSESSNDDLVARQGRMYTLNQPKAVFKELCKNRAVRVWLEEQIEERNQVYFVIGVDTLFEARTSGGEEVASQQAANITVPVAEALGVPAGGAMDVGLNAEHAHSHGTHLGYQALGENIYAIRLQKVKFSIWETDVDSAKLQRGECWYSVPDNRSADVGEGEYFGAELVSDVEDLDEEQEVEDGKDLVYVFSGKEVVA
ncbi:hypothetical protein GLAREA_08011 [Glarea lozoyensis ATCC 20868]|uniref:Uncharacterized protein n=1 Tax=Glarea lozoyensis (strain ATCC 20868 / MF5171) TaxID=1116229 RepID=S3CWG2_GLAL2|nr:uncharacterized protein GLAREA_08011 [Glarea lozoyensis ATCC 20868]EPE24161.1 hypothetical protein GLAREA_08011 [Glarea lozoyensis ATCC 20868]